MANIKKEACPEQLSRGDVEHVANLARLKSDGKELELFTEQLSDVLEYFQMLDAVETKEVNPIVQINSQKNFAAPDEVKAGLSNEVISALAPEAKDGFIKVKSILK